MDNIELIIRNGQTLYYPCVEEGITWETERMSSPGKLTFNVIADSILNIEEGNAVRLKINETNVFYGFVFTMSRNKDNTLKITAYDQLRYLKNKDTITYKNKTATELIKMIATDFNLNLGTIDETEYVFNIRTEDDSELFTIIENALAETTRQESKIFVLYDDFGKLTLKNIENMKLPLLYDNDTAEDFDYMSSIDSNTYNKIKLTYDNENTGKRDVYIAQDTSNINKWGVLQFKGTEKANESIKTKDTEGDSKTTTTKVLTIDLKAKADALLGFYNKKTKSLSLKNALGDLRIRAGTSILVKLDLADTNVRRYMTVEKAKHTFKNGEHLMDLTLRGGAFNV